MMNYLITSRKWMISFLLAGLFLLCILAGIMVIPMPAPVRNTSIGAVGLAFIFYLWLRASTLVTAFSCTNAGLDIRTLTGRKESIGWDQIHSFRRGALLVVRNHPTRIFLVIPTDRLSLNLSYMPKDAIDNLTALLREASNARIMD